MQIEDRIRQDQNSHLVKTKVLDLVKTNVYSRLLSEKLLISGACIRDEWPQIFGELAVGRTCLEVCPEEVHINTVIEKLASILAKSTVKELCILTKDGSPHCIGLHFAAEWAKKMTKSDDTLLRYFVIEHGKLVEVSSEKVEEKRHLSK
jgi:hypothetical protein